MYTTPGNEAEGYEQLEGRIEFAWEQVDDDVETLHSDPGNQSARNRMKKNVDFLLGVSEKNRKEVTEKLQELPEDVRVDLLSGQKVEG